jgi:hypothetical protein
MSRWGGPLLTHPVRSARSPSRPPSDFVGRLDRHICQVKRFRTFSPPPPAHQRRNEMRITSLSFWLTCTSIASSTRALSPALPRTHRVEASSHSSLHRQQHRSASVAAGIQRRPSRRQEAGGQVRLGVASADIVKVAEMERGLGGRIEGAFEAAKVKGEAAFVTFITAGYPTAQGTCFVARHGMARRISMRLQRQQQEHHPGS